MPNILALDTATEACSVAVNQGADQIHRFELIPRQHSQRLFSMLDEVVPGANLRELGIDALAYNHGPGSFTGLRIAAAAMQGLAFSYELPVAGVSTLACMAQGAWRRSEIPAESAALVLLDARINEIYWGVYVLENGLASALCPDRVSAPQELALPDTVAGLSAIGSGLRYADLLPEGVLSRCSLTLPELWPDSLDLLDLGESQFRAGRVTAAEQVHPVYLRNEIGWKKLAEQGRQSGG